MNLDSKKIAESYWNWLKDNIKYRNISDDLVEIQTPFVDSQNDFIVIFIKKINEEYLLTDDGRTLFDLQSSGVTLTEKRLSQLMEFINAQGASYNKGSEEIYVITSWDLLPQRKNDLIQTVLNVGDMFLTAQANIKNLFYEEVASYFKEKHIAYIPNSYLNGSGGVKHKVDFMIAKIDSPPQLIRTVNNPNKTIFENEIFKYVDIAKCNDSYNNSEKIIFINNTEKEVKPEHIRMIESYGIKPILWSERDLTNVF